MKSQKNNLKLILLVASVSLIFLTPIYNSYLDGFVHISDSVNLKLSGEIPGTQEWIANANFSTQQNWFIASEGDTSDVDGNLNENQANFIIRGEKLTFSNISGTPNATDWFPGRESEISILPDVYGINSYGCYAAHEYWESSGLNLYGVPGNQSRNNPIIHWNRIVAMPFDMNDYIITHAELTALFNGSANLNLETPFEQIEGWDAIPPTGYAAEYDHARYYVYVSDLNKLETYELAYNQTVELGRGYHGRTGRSVTISVLNDTYMKVVEDDELKFYLSRVLSHNYRNFRITLGIDIYAEDNYASAEIDTWYYLYIKSCNLTFDFEKKIDRSSAISWNQICDKVSDLSEYPVLVQDANLNFKYKVDKAWNTSLSPNSEIRILINNNKHSETIKLTSATTNYQEAKLGGFDVTSLITDDVDLSIQVFIADNFVSDENITISIDDVSLVISYLIITPNEPPIELTWLIYTLIGAIGGIVIVFGLYQGYFKYPPIVRKIKKMRRKIDKSKRTKKVLLRERDEIINNDIQEKKKMLEIEPSESNQSQTKNYKDRDLDLKELKEGDVNYEE
ncbi:MAG: hypothetical protein ACFFFB_08135 [Candidatus Heimdallarchaeota archaeon]